MNLQSIHFFSKFFLLAALLGSCTPRPENDQKTKKSIVFNKDSVGKQFIKANQQLMQKENDEMDYYAKSHNMPFVRTASGIRYFVYKPSAKGDSLRDNMEVTMDYDLKLLNGTLCYSSKTEGKKTFIIGHDNLESGIHKGLQYLKRGDKAVLLIPSPLAHGLMGDYKKIPPQMPIVYDIQVY
ncbi:MAG: FKBP-type peptidyl-prolyl cis-trans isomerase [Bacteroidetes bacterium]|nr:FKBP-type peptidyl-prolyl cis-trans isomerase [Bacteroidota bacterium]